jgi:hypothetical protein
MRRINLTKDVMQVLRPALFLAKGTIKSEINQGISNLYVADNNKLYVVLRPEFDELVVVAVAGHGLYQSRLEIINFGIQNGFHSIRFHTREPELLERALMGLDFKLIEVRRPIIGRDFVYRLDL